MFQVTILGSSSATPAHKRHLSSQLVSHNDRLFLIDCGEGTQFQLLKYRIRLQRLDAIFISHLHGDHFFGLIGLLCTLSNQERTRPLQLFCPAGLKEILKLQFRVADTQLRYDLNITELSEKQACLLYENNGLEVSTIPLQHRIYCNGFLFKEKRKKPRFNQVKAKAEDIPLAYYSLIKSGNNLELGDGRKIIAEDFLFPPPPSLVYAYCSDTRYTHDILPYIQNVDLLYHEATFMQDLQNKAVITMHSTANEAADIARLANVKKLVIGHFSARYQDLNPLLEEAREVFKESYLAVEGLPIDIH